jgi:excisionase family DNA binding protein
MKGGNTHVDQSQPSAQIVASEPYLSLKSLARYSGLSVRTLRIHLKHPERPLPCYRVGGRILVRRSEFDQWVQQFRVQPDGSLDDLVDAVLSGLG